MQNMRKGTFLSLEREDSDSENEQYETSDLCFAAAQDDLESEIEASTLRFLDSVADMPVIASELDAMEIELEGLPLYLQEDTGLIH